MQRIGSALLMFLALACDAQAQVATGMPLCWDGAQDSHSNLVASAVGQPLVLRSRYTPAGPFAGSAFILDTDSDVGNTSNPAILLTNQGSPSLAVTIGHDEPGFVGFNQLTWDPAHPVDSVNSTLWLKKDRVQITGSDFGASKSVTFECDGVAACYIGDHDHPWTTVTASQFTGAGAVVVVKVGLTNGTVTASAVITSSSKIVCSYVDTSSPGILSVPSASRDVVHGTFVVQSTSANDASTVECSIAQ